MRCTPRPGRDRPSTWCRRPPRCPTRATKGKAASRSGGANVAFPAAHSALSALVRGYADTWGVNSFTAEMTYSQYVGRSLLIRIRARAYEQSGAVFFWDAVKYQNFGPPPNPGTNGTGS